MDWYVSSRCYDAKSQWLRKEEYTEVTKRLSTRTGWTLRGVEGWLARSRSKACKGTRVLGTMRAREEAIQVAQGGPRGERARAVQAIREDLNKRILGSASPVVTVAMVREQRDNMRGVCRGAREGATAAILMAATQEAMQVEMFEVGGGGQDRDAVAEAQQWAVEAGWIRKKEAVATLKAWQTLAIRRGKDPQHIVIEMGVGWAGPQRYSGRCSAGQ